MIRSHRLFSVLLFATVAACGGDDGPANQPDAGPGHDAAPGEDAGPIADAAPDPDGPVQPVDCDHTEASDANNDTYTVAGTPEDAGTVTTSVTICGQVDSTHFDEKNQVVDVDAFTATVPEGPVYATLSGPGLETIEEVFIGVYGGPNLTTYVGDAVYEDGYAMFFLPSLPAGTYEFAVFTASGAALTASIPYKMRIHHDTRCPKITADADHTEGADDGANDVFVVDWAAEPFNSPTPNEADAAEATNLTIGHGEAKRISGTLAETPVAGEYKDVDTFAFTTGPDVNELQIRLNWADMNDLDWLLFDENGEFVSYGSAIPQEGEDEYAPVRVQPNTTYWVWAGLYDGYTGPTPYDLSICGTQFEH